MKTKRCTKCKKIKLLKYFGKNKVANDGFRCSCKDCMSVYQKDYSIRKKKGKFTRRQIPVVNFGRKLISMKRILEKQLVNVNKLIELEKDQPG